MFYFFFFFFDKAEKKKKKKPPTTPPMTVGYITMTADLCHSDHFRLIRACKERCNYLIVGLVTDELGAKQKRVPYLTYEHRRSILENCRYVDLVVRHNGEPKEEAWQKLNFDILFSSDEYFLSQEFQNFHEAVPNVPCIYVPKNQSTSTSTIGQRLEQKIMANQKSPRVMCMGVGGLVTETQDGYVIKQINVSSAEKPLGTSDVLGFMQFGGEMPRNWKNNQSCKNIYPMISGVNVFREIAIGQFYAGKSWSLFDSFTEHELERQKVPSDENNFCNNDNNNNFNKNNVNLLNFANRVAEQRQFPASVIYMKQKHGGQTLDKIMDLPKTNDYLEDIAEQIVKICCTLLVDGVVHGDLHPGNICVDAKGKVSFIDFGWTTAKFFDLCDGEKLLLNKYLQSKLDFHHLYKSCPPKFQAYLSKFEHLLIS